MEIMGSWLELKKVEWSRQSKIRRTFLSEEEVFHTKVKVRLFSTCRETAGIGQLMVDLPDGVAVEGLFEELIERYPGLSKSKRNVTFAVNKKCADEKLRLKNGDEVAVMPPVGGG